MGASRLVAVVAIHAGVEGLVDVQIAVAVEVGDGRAPTLAAVRHALVGRPFEEGAPLVQVEPIDTADRRHEDVQIAVQIEVTGAGVGRGLVVGQAASARDLCEAASTVIPVQEVGQVLHGDVQVEIAVAVVVEPLGAAAEAGVVRGAALADVGEGPAIVPVQAVGQGRAVVGQVEVLITVVVDVGPGTLDMMAHRVDAGVAVDDKGGVAPVLEELVGLTAGVGQVEIEVAVVVVVGDGGALAVGRAVLDAGVPAPLAEAAVAVVQIEKVRRSDTSDVEIWIAVVVEVAPDRATTVGAVAQTDAGRHVGEVPAAVVAVQPIGSATGGGEDVVVAVVIVVGRRGAHLVGAVSHAGVDLDELVGAVASGGEQRLRRRGSGEAEEDGGEGGAQNHPAPPVESAGYSCHSAGSPRKEKGHTNGAGAALKRPGPSLASSHGVRRRTALCLSTAARGRRGYVELQLWRPMVQPNKGSVNLL